MLSVEFLGPGLMDLETGLIFLFRSEDELEGLAEVDVEGVGVFGGLGVGCVVVVEG